MKTNEWISKVEEEILAISNLEAKDRLETLDYVYRCLSAIDASLEGWSEWIGNPSIMNTFNEDDLNEMLDDFKKITALLLRHDIKWTKKLSDMQKGRSGTKTSDKDDKSYVT